MRKSRRFSVTLRLQAESRFAFQAALNGNEIARSEWYLQGRLPAAHAARGHRLRFLPRRNTTFGLIGVKTWVYRGDIYAQKKRETAAAGRRKHFLTLPRQSAGRSQAVPSLSNGSRNGCTASESRGDSASC